MGAVEDFNAYRSKMNEKILASDSLIIKRIFNLDTNQGKAGFLRPVTATNCELPPPIEERRRRHATLPTKRRNR
jgi:hypothetical protein